MVAMLSRGDVEKFVKVVKELRQLGRTGTKRKAPRFLYLEGTPGEWLWWRFCLRTTKRRTGWF
jgi:hypothetical protein